MGHVEEKNPTVLTGKVITESTGSFTSLALTTGASTGAALQADGDGALTYIKNNLTATTDPAVGDDSVDGYAITSLWLNTVSGEIFRCLSAAEGAADWQTTSLTLDDLGGAAVLDVGTGAGTVCAGDDGRLSDERDPTAHASEHTDGTDDIQDATVSQKGLATATQITKLGTIDENADVTDLSEHVIDDLSDVTAATPTAGDSLVFENGDWINKNVTNVLGAGVGMPLYLDDTVVVDDYGSLLKIPDTVTAEQTAGVAVTSATGFIKGFFYNAELLRDAWNAGEWIFNIWGRVSSATGVSTVIATMYKVPAEDGTVTTTGTGTSRTATISGSSGTPFVSGDANADQTLAGYLQTAGGTFQITGYTSATVATIATATEYTNETSVACTVHKYLFQAETGEINNTTATTTLHNVSTIQATVDLDLTDKAALRLYGKTTSGSSITISITYNGTEHYSNFRAPIYPKHNDLDGLNLGDYQHATVAEQAAWDAKQAALTRPIDDAQLIQSQAVNGQTGVTVTIPAAVASTDYIVLLQFSTNPSDIGQIWFDTKALNSFKMYNTGSNTTAIVDLLVVELS